MYMCILMYTQCTHVDGKTIVYVMLTVYTCSSVEMVHTSLLMSTAVPCTCTRCMGRVALGKYFVYKSSPFSVAILKVSTTHHFCKYDIPWYMYIYMCICTCVYMYMYLQRIHNYSES